ncbi:MAG: HlyD family efflux transporter periplasmic adaptor subunit [Myxococcales bacterium]|nr:HlyD family efflux transporter periplasmic adaptor subunit [Myxococcales bacterium]
MKIDRELSLYTFSSSGRSASSEVHAAVPRLTRFMWVSGLVVALLLLASPWQQNVRGTGRVVAYAPMDRLQTIEAPIKGRVVRWHVQEGSQVRAGDPIADIADNDPEYLARLERERSAAVEGLRALESMMLVTESRIASLRSVRDTAITNAQLYVQIARDKRDAAEQEVIAAEAAYETARINLDRQRSLGSEGLSSTRKVELAQLKLDTNKSKRDAAKAKLAAATREVQAASAKLGNVTSKEEANINKANEALGKLKSDIAKAKAEVAKAEVKVSRQQQMAITAPIDGTVLRLVANGGGEFVKAGDSVATIVPDTESRAVELLMAGNDAPLITPGREVRLQFEGWPAVQFVGWPSVAVGTFGGRVAFVDATDDGSGRFRIVVTPDPNQEPWPEARFLRQGVRVNGWVLLNRVKVAFELWRQLNGFPPVVDRPSKGDGGAAKEGGKK